MGDIDGEYSSQYDDRGKVCDYCSREFLFWRETPDGWRLFENVADGLEVTARLHVCDRVDRDWG